MVAEKLPADKIETENNLTISTKLSTDQLICKSPQTSSPEGSVRSLRQIPLKEEGPNGRKDETPVVLYYGVLQILFGLLMAVFGVLVLVHGASLSQLGGGLWGGCLSTLTGVLGVLSAARDCCPLKTSPRRLALTAFLALSLVSLAVAHLTLALAAIGLARDSNRTDDDDSQEPSPTTAATGLDLVLPGSYSTLLSGAGLVLVAACECVVAALSAWHCARALCPCFRQPPSQHEDVYGAPPASHSTKDMLVSSWLGKHQQPVYVVATNHRTKRAGAERPRVPSQYQPGSAATGLDLVLPGSYSTLLSGAGLVLVAACECVVAALSAWHCARALCPCFRQPPSQHEDVYGAPPASHSTKDMLVSSWLGKHQQPVYVVATNQRTKRMTSIPVGPVYSLPTPPPSLLAPQMLGYPLIPAPLGTTPPPFIHARPHGPHHLPEKAHKKRRRYPSDRQLQQQQRMSAKPVEKPKKQKKSREKQKTITEEEVAKTYTGLDRVIAEEFIEICDSSKTSNGSDTSGCTSSETTSNLFTGERL